MEKMMFLKRLNGKCQLISIALVRGMKGWNTVSLENLESESAV